MAAPSPLVPCFYTTVKNVSGKTRPFGFLGRHGKTLTPNQEYTEFGDLVDKLTTAGVKDTRRAKLAFERACKGFTSAAGVVYPVALHIKESPKIVIYDTGASLPKQLTLINGTLGVTDPCYDTGY